MPRTSSREQEFTEFVRSRRSRLLGVAYLLCGNRHAAEDLVQIALAKLYVAWPRVRRLGGEDAYARRVLVNVSIDEHRRPWRREQANERVPDTPVRAAAHDLEDKHELLQALGSIPPGQRQIVILRYWLDLSIEEVAADLDISTGTVKSQSAKALNNLRRELTTIRRNELVKERA